MPLFRNGIAKVHTFSFPPNFSRTFFQYFFHTPLLCIILSHWLHARSAFEKNFWRHIWQGTKYPSEVYKNNTSDWMITYSDSEIMGKSGNADDGRWSLMPYGSGYCSEIDWFRIFRKHIFSRAKIYSEAYREILRNRLRSLFSGRIFLTEFIRRYSKATL